MQYICVLYLGIMLMDCEARNLSDPVQLNIVKRQVSKDY